MSLKEKIENAEETTWLTDGMPEWRVCLIVWYAKLKVKLIRIVKNR